MLPKRPESTLASKSRSGVRSPAHPSDPQFPLLFEPTPYTFVSPDFVYGTSPTRQPGVPAAVVNLNKALQEIYDYPQIPDMITTFLVDSQVQEVVERADVNALIATVTPNPIAIDPTSVFRHVSDSDLEFFLTELKKAQFAATVEHYSGSPPGYDDRTRITTTKVGSDIVQIRRHKLRTNMEVVMKATIRSMPHAPKVSPPSRLTFFNDNYYAVLEHEDPAPLTGTLSDHILYYDPLDLDSFFTEVLASAQTAAEAILFEEASQPSEENFSDSIAIAESHARAGTIPVEDEFSHLAFHDEMASQDHLLGDFKPESHNTFHGRPALVVDCEKIHQTKCLHGVYEATLLDTSRICGHSVCSSVGKNPAYAQHLITLMEDGCRSVHRASCTIFDNVLTNPLMQCFPVTPSASKEYGSVGLIPTPCTQLGRAYHRLGFCTDEAFLDETPFPEGPQHVYVHHPQVLFRFFIDLLKIGSAFVRRRRRDSGTDQLGVPQAILFQDQSNLDHLRDWKIKPVRKPHPLKLKLSKLEENFDRLKKKAIGEDRRTMRILKYQSQSRGVRIRTMQPPLDIVWEHALVPEDPPLVFNDEMFSTVTAKVDDYVKARVQTFVSDPEVHIALQNAANGAIDSPEFRLRMTDFFTDVIKAASNKIFNFPKMNDDIRMVLRLVKCLSVAALVVACLRFIPMAIPLCLGILKFISPVPLDTSSVANRFSDEIGHFEMDGTFKLDPLSMPEVDLNYFRKGITIVWPFLTTMFFSWLALPEAMSALSTQNFVKFSLIPKLTSSADFVATAVLDFFQECMDWLSTNSYISQYYRLKTYGREELDEWADDVLAAIRKYQSNILSADRGFLSHLTYLDLRYVQFLKRHSLVEVAVLRSLQPLHGRLARLMEVVARKCNDALSFRQEPVVLFLYGLPGVGKSGMLPKLCYALYSLTEPSVPFPAEQQTRYVYPRAIEQDFWDGYTQQCVTIYDDFLQKADMKGAPGTSEVMEIIRAGNVFPNRLHKASIEDKELNCDFRSEFLILTTNSRCVEKTQAQSITCPPAVQRRLKGHSYEVHVHERYLVPHSDTSGKYVQIDTSKTKSALDTDIYYFTAINSFNGEPIDNTRYTFDELVARVYNTWRSKKAHYESTIKELRSFAEAENLDAFKARIRSPEINPGYVDQGLESVLELALAELPPAPAEVPMPREFKFPWPMEEPTHAEIFRGCYHACPEAYWRAYDHVLFTSKDDKYHEKCKDFFYVYGRLYDATISYEASIAHEVIGQDHEETIKSSYYERARDFILRVEKWKLILGMVTVITSVSATAYGIYHSMSSLSSQSNKDLGARAARAAAVPKSGYVNNGSVCLNTQAVVSSTAANVFRITVDTKIMDACVLVVDNDLALINHHVFATYKVIFDARLQRDPTIGDIIIYLVTPSGLKLPHHFYANIAKGYKLTDQDDVWCFRPILPPHARVRDISSKFMKPTDLTQLSAHSRKIVFYDGINGVIKEDSKATYRVSQKGTPINQDVLPRVLYRKMAYDVGTAPGMCGSPVFLSHEGWLGPRIIFGIHSAGAASLGLATYVDPTKFSKIRDQFRILLRTETTKPEYPGADPELFPDAKITTPSRPLDSPMRPSPLNFPGSPIGEPEKFPAPVRPFYKNGERIDPLQVAVSNYDREDKSAYLLSDPKKALAISQAKAVVRQVILGPASHEFPFILSFEEAIMGMPAIGIPSINRSTSPGFPWSSKFKDGKYGIFGRDDTFDLNNPASDALRRAVEELRVNLISDTVRLDQICFTDVVKADETRSAAKCAAGKARLISASPLCFTILMKQYFGAYAAYLRRTKIENGMAIGIVENSNDWHILADHLRTFPNHLDGDMGDYDASQLAAFQQDWADLPNAYYNDEHSLLRERIVHYLINSKHILTEVVEEDGVRKLVTLIYQMLHSNPSGQPMTSECNSQYTLTILAYAFAILCPSKALDFTQFVRAVCFGDDHVLSVSDACKLEFTPRKVGEVLADMGMRYTPAKKDKELTDDFTPFEELTFLQRGFHFDTEINRYIAPLNLSSIKNMLLWMHKENQHVSTRSQMLTNIDTALAEYASHGPAVFYREYDNIAAALKLSECGIPMLATRDYRLFQYRRHGCANPQIFSASVLGYPLSEYKSQDSKSLVMQNKRSAGLFSLTEQDDATKSSQPECTEILSGKVSAKQDHC